MGGGGGGGGALRDFFGSEILDKRDFFWVYYNAGDFFGSRLKKRSDFFWILYFSSAQINNNISAIYCWCGDFLVYVKNAWIFVDKF